MPSTTSSSVAMPLASSTVMTPSLPTFCIASAIILPISVSPLAEIVPTLAVSAGLVIFLERLCSSSTTAVTALSMPRFRSIGFMNEPDGPEARHRQGGYRRRRGAAEALQEDHQPGGNRQGRHDLRQRRNRDRQDDRRGDAEGRQRGCHHRRGSQGHCDR